MYALVLLQKILMPERFITHITGEWPPLTTMYAMMFLHTTLTPE
jgi:hypothetical protein